MSIPTPLTIKLSYDTVHITIIIVYIFNVLSDKCIVLHLRLIMFLVGLSGLSANFMVFKLAYSRSVLSIKSFY